VALTRGTYAQAACAALAAAMRERPQLVVLGEDVGRGGVFGQYRGLREEFGADRVIDTPISEATIMGAAVGMALAGLVPVVEMRLVDFALCAIDEVVNQAAKARFMLGGQARVPMVIRMPIGLWSGSAAQHSQSLEAWFAHIPGLSVVTPAAVADNCGLLRAALSAGDPVIYMEHKELWPVAGEFDPLQEVELGRARRVREGADLTLVSWSRAVYTAAEAAAQLSGEGIETDLFDLRTIWPWDRDAVLASAAASGRLLVVHESVQAAGFGAEIAASAAEAVPGLRVARLGTPRIPVAYAPALENESRLQVRDVVRAARSLGAPRADHL